MKNGYALASKSGLAEIDQQLTSSDESELDGLRELLRIGIQWNTQVTISDTGHKVTKVYCSALPVACSGLPSNQWATFARLILEAAYEATVCSAILNAAASGNNKLYLTLLWWRGVRQWDGLDHRCNHAP